MIKKDNYLEVALKYHRSGLHVIPVKANKRPYRSWTKYQTEQTEEDVRKEFSQPCEGIAMVTGVNGLQAMDIDVKYDLRGDLFNRYIGRFETLHSLTIYDFLVQRTPSGGYHMIFKSDEIEGNKKIAERPATDEELEAHNLEAKAFNEKLKADQEKGERLKEKKRKELNSGERLPKVLIETRGQYGYVLVFPSPNYAIENGDFENVPTIGIKERRWLMQSATELNEIEKALEPCIIDRKVKTDSVFLKDNLKWEGKSSWDDYNERSDFVTFMSSNGWTENARVRTPLRVYLKRPGNTDADFSGNFNVDLRLFKCFSTSTVFEAEKAYTPFAAYTLLEHNGDYSAASRALYHLGFGDRQVKKENNILNSSSQSTNSNEQQSQEVVKTSLEILKENEFDYDEEIKEANAFLTVNVEGKKWKLGGRGMLGVAVGPAKHGKSLLTGAILSSGLSGGNPIINFELDMGGEEMVDFDTEQSKYWFSKTQKRIHNMANVPSNSKMYKAFSVRGFSQNERRQLIKDYIYANKKLGLIVIDGIVDLAVNYNDVDCSQSLVNDLLVWSDDTNTCIICVLHLARSTGQMRGHLGTELQNKCDFAIQINKDENIYTVSCKESRFPHFPTFSFERRDDTDGTPFIQGDSDFVDFNEPVKSDFSNSPIFQQELEKRNEEASEIFAEADNAMKNARPVNNILFD